MDEIRIASDSVEIWRVKRGEWTYYKRLTPFSFNRLLYLARKYRARLGAYATYFVGEEVTPSHQHYLSIFLEL